MSDGPLISHAQAAEYLGVPEATLHQWNWMGKGPKSYKLGRHRKYRIADLDTFIESRASQQVLVEFRNDTGKPEKLIPVLPHKDAAS